ncbi:packaged DNA stabilization protein [Methylobacterium sp. 1030]|uniref:packaged DNA stabilization protein n=1 Tax=Methylobacterium sp. 1030 TaxID=3156404 RepID=UPI003398D396
MRLPLVGPSYRLDGRSFDCQRTINLFLIASETGTSKSPACLRLTPGLALFAQAGGGPGRGCKTTANDGRGFVVSGNGFYEVLEDGTTVLRGTLLTSVGMVSIAENGSQVMIVDGRFGYIFTIATNAFAQITDPDFPACSMVDYQDGYFIVFKLGTGQPYISAINDGFSWDPLDFSSTESSPDNLVGLISDHGQMQFFGTRSVEVFNNTGNAAFPFERAEGAIIQTGCAAGFTIQRFDNTVVWLGIDEQGRGVVWKMNGYNAQRISTQAIEGRIASAKDFTESYAWTYHQEGHIFYCLQVKGLDTTLVYDGTVGQWHERSFFNKSLSRSEQHRAAGHFFFAQKNLVIDRENGNIYNLSNKVYSDNGDAIIWERTFPHLSQEGAIIPHNELVIDIEPGQGLANGQGSDPKISLCYSDDGGFTFTSFRSTSAGKIGRYKARARWTRLGSSRDRVYHLRGSDPIFWQLNDAYLNPPRAA